MVVIIMVMKVVNVNEMKAKLSEFLDAVGNGERVVICKRNRPVAELRPIEQRRTDPRPVGGGPHFFAVPDSFFDPMPDEFLDAFELGPVYPAASRPSRVAERPDAPYGATRPSKPRR
jgi:prevent-host-death family protein